MALRRLPAHILTSLVFRGRAEAASGRIPASLCYMTVGIAIETLGNLTVAGEGLAIM
jgi:hypothetical protein